MVPVFYDFLPGAFAKCMYKKNDLCVFWVTWKGLVLLNATLVTGLEAQKLYVRIRVMHIQAS